jgi:hypothetical protein
MLETLFHVGTMLRRIYSRNAAQCDRDFLIIVCCIDISPRGAEIERPNSQTTGSRNLMEQLAPRKNAKAPRNVFVGSAAMEMDEWRCRPRHPSAGDNAGPGPQFRHVRFAGARAFMARRGAKRE